jgi:hypothetical protein
LVGLSTNGSNLRTVSDTGGPSETPRTGRPDLGFAPLAPGTAVTGIGTWNQDKPNTSQRVTPGKYTLIVDNKHFSFPLQVSSS